MVTTSDIQFYLFLLFLWFISTLLFRTFVKSKSNIRHPPSPLALPIIGHLHLIGSILPKSFKTLASRYGPLMRLRIGSSTNVIVSNAAIAKEMLKTHEMSFVSRPSFEASDFILYPGSEFVSADYGRHWRFMKKICMTELLSAPQVNRFLDIRKDEVMKLLEILVKCSAEGKVCDVGVELMTVANNVTCRMAMSARCSGNGNESKQIWEFVKGMIGLLPKLVLGEMLGPLSKFDLFGYGRRLKALFMQFDRLVEGIMMEHEQQENAGERERMDMMDILLDIYRDETAEVKLTRNDIKSFFMEIFMAGTETMSVSMQWTLAELINHPEVFKKLREEIKSIVGSSRLVEESDVPNLPYLQAVVKESLRLHPPAPLIFRKCREDCKIDGYDILTGERVIFNLYAIMRDPSTWENPTAFVPERFLVSSIGNIDHQHQVDMKIHNFNYFPFGSGRRGCPGASLASAVMHALTAMLVQCFDWEASGGERVDTKEGPGFSIGMAQPLVCYPIMQVDLLKFRMVSK